jgi:hypothetical protein
VGGETVAAAVPSAVLSDLREAFGQEIAECLADGDLPGHAHVLASSAWVVGEPDIARLARAVEHDAAGGPVAELLERLRGYVA